MLNSPLKYWRRMRDWWSSPLGQSFLAIETEEVKKVVPKLFGYHLLILGEPQLIQCISESPITHRVWIHPQTIAIETGSPLNARPDKLPILSDSVDVVYLAHCLEFINNPHEVLRESFRVLVPEGYVIISGFNPWSSWGMYRWVMRYIKRLEWDGRFISVTKLKDWLSLLGFDVMRVRGYFFRPPVSHPGMLQRLKWLELLRRWCWPFFGAGYVLVARKRVIMLTPIRPVWQKSRQLVPTGVVEPVAMKKPNLNTGQKKF